MRVWWSTHPVGFIAVRRLGNQKSWGKLPPHKPTGKGGGEWRGASVTTRNEKNADMVARQLKQVCHVAKWEWGLGRDMRSC